MKISYLIVLVMLLTACAANSPATTVTLPAIETALPAASNSPATTVTLPAIETALPAASQPDNPVSTLPTWQTLPLTNARTGETFTLADFAGKTVFVEPMATWCTNCRQQLGNVSRAKSQVAADQFVFIALSVETNITAGELSQYADENGFDWLFAVMTPDMLSELTAAFGRTITNPPSTPHFIIRPDGTTTALITGIESDAQILEQLITISGG